MFYVTLKDTETGQTFTNEYAHELDAAHRITDGEIYINLEVVAHNVDRSKFRR
jgi:hypothetical protein